MPVKVSRNPIEKFSTKNHTYHDDVRYIARPILSFHGTDVYKALESIQQGEVGLVRLTATSIVDPTEELLEMEMERFAEMEMANLAGMEP